MIAAIYARKSSDQHGVSDEQKSVVRQVEHARAYAARKGWSVGDAHVYVDDGISGAEFATRPGYMRLLNALKPRAPFQVLVVSELSRLGREQLETGYAAKQLSQAGVTIVSYLEDREILLDTPTDKFLMSAVNFAAEIEREKARQRVTDAMMRKARAGHVTGGRLFGYANVERVGSDGRRSHVEREIIDAEASVVRRIFALCADGHGVKGIAKMLNEARAPSPRAQRGRSQTWAPSSVREVLYRTTYRGVVTWNQSRKRNRWGQHAQTARPASDWIEVAAPHLRIVTDQEWSAAHARLDAARASYMRGTDGRRFGRPPIGSPSKYLLTNLAECGLCGNTMKVLRRQRGRRPGQFYGCAGYHDRGRVVCTNGASIAMEDANQFVVEALLENVLSPALIGEAVDAALRAICADDDAAQRRGQLEALDAEIRQRESERQRLVDAIAAGGELAGLLDALKVREKKLRALRDERERLQVPRRPALDPDAVRGELLALAADWRGVLVSAPTEVRPLLSQLLTSRVRFLPSHDHRWEIRGQATLTGLFSRLVPSDVPLGVASPAGFEPALPA
jgi:site-specific DNA recombinase